MRIGRFVVSGLFGRFNHDLEFPANEQITIMIGPNGFGKTMVLRIIDCLFNRSVRTLARMPFHEVRIHFDDDSEVRVLRQQSDEEDPSSETVLELLYRDGSGNQESFEPERRIDLRDVGITTEAIEEIIPSLERVGRTQWLDERTGEVLELEEIIEKYGDQLPIDEKISDRILPKWMQNIRESVNVHFINTERLIHPVQATERYYRARPIKTERTVRHYSKELANRIQSTLSEYGSLSQSLDRTFPARLVEDTLHLDVVTEDLRKELREVDTKRSKLVEAGLLARETEHWRAAGSLENVDESKREVLAVYARDAKEKLGVFDDLYERVNLLKRIANSRLLHKSVAVGPAGLSITSNGSNLELEMLSSGEQHELVILCELLFRVPDNSFILIDEPELSLHVAWQEQFLNDLDKIAKLSNFRVLLATHSPQIIGDRWDLAIELKGPNKQ